MLIEELKPGDIYTFTTDSVNRKYRFIKKILGPHIYPENRYYHEGYELWTGLEAPVNIERATFEEALWLEECIKEQRFVKRIFNEIY